MTNEDLELIERNYAMSSPEFFTREHGQQLIDAVREKNAQIAELTESLGFVCKPEKQWDRKKLERNDSTPELRKAWAEIDAAARRSMVHQAAYAATRHLRANRVECIDERGHQDIS